MSDLTHHVVICRSLIAGHWQTFIAERDANDVDFETTVRDILAGQIEGVRQVFAFNPIEGWARDVSEDIAIECARRLGDAPSHDLRDFIERHCGVGTALAAMA